jgi:hypothetical protein
MPGKVAKRYTPAEFLVAPEGMVEKAYDNGDWTRVCRTLHKALRHEKTKIGAREKHHAIKRTE